MSTRFEKLPIALEGLVLLQRRPSVDERGFFERLYCREELQSHGADWPIVQANRTLTASRGTVRGLHFQLPPHMESKLITCLRGKVLDVVVDIRRGSPSFLDWHAEVLSAENHRSLLVPPGFAHGFQALSENCEMLYMHSCAFVQEAERGLNPCDPLLGISWPEEITAISTRDRNHPMLDSQFEGVTA